MQDYEEYGASFRQPRAMRDDGGPANNDFQRYDGNQVATEGRPPTRPVSPDDEEAKKKAAAGTSVGAAVAQPQQPQTFAQMQQAGLARPPAPMTNPMLSYPSYGSADGSRNPYSTTGERNTMTPFGGAGSTLTADQVEGFGSSPGGSMEGTLKQAWEGYKPQEFGTGKDTEMSGKIREMLMKAMGNPSRYDSDVAKQSFDMLSGDIDDDYNARDQNLRESISSRGLGAIGDGTIGTSDQRFQNLQRRSAKQRMATDILREQANTYGQDRSSAIRDAMGYGNDQFGNELAGADFNARRKQEAYNNYTGYGQQSFENQQATAEMRDRQRRDSEAMLMKLLGVG
jgi:hypothetical protein